MYRVQGTEFNGIFYIENVSTNNEKRHSWHLSLTNTEMILIFLYIAISHGIQKENRFNLKVIMMKLILRLYDVQSRYIVYSFNQTPGHSKVC